MFQLSVQDIHLAASAADKEQAIRLVASALAQAGCVAPGYVGGMLARELQTTTYLGNGIAIPHGTTDTRDQVLRTGVQVFQFPQGIDWGDERAYLVIGIAARSDEHLALLRQLTHVLSDEALAERIKTASDAETLRALLQGEAPCDGAQAALKLDEETLSLAVQAADLPTLQALNAGRLKAAGAVDASFISHVMSHDPLNLGQGIWFNDSPDGNLASAVAVSRPQVPFEQQGQTVAMLVTVSAADDKPQAVLNRLSQLLIKQQASRLLSADSDGLLALLTRDEAVSAGEATAAHTAASKATANSTINSATNATVNNPAADITDSDTLSAEFIVRNAHGLHARPGAMLVNTIKRFTSEINVANLDGDGKVVNGRSLMKVVALGVKQGHRLRFTARGDDAAQALQAIGEAISQGLGEGAA